MRLKARVVEEVKPRDGLIVESYRAYPDAVLSEGGTVRYKFDDVDDPWNSVTVSLEDGGIVLRFYPRRGRSVLAV